MNLTNNTETLLARIAEALERLSPPLAQAPDFSSAEAFVWRAETQILAPVKNVSRVDIALLRGVDFLRDQLVGNTERFARGLPANNVLLWDARHLGHREFAHAPPAPQK